MYITVFLTTWWLILSQSPRSKCGMPNPLIFEKIQTPQNKKNRKKLPAPWPTSIHKPSVTSLVWNISIGQLVYLSCCASSQLLHTCLLAEYEKLEKVLDFIAATKTISVINILLILNPKQLLRGKLTLSQLKPGQKYNGGEEFVNERSRWDLSLQMLVKLQSSGNTSSFLNEVQEIFQKVFLSICS